MRQQGLADLLERWLTLFPVTVTGLHCGKEIFRIALAPIVGLFPVTVTGLHCGQTFSAGGTHHAISSRSP